MQRIKMTAEEWMTEGKRRFGADHNQWKFKCPVCGHVASVQDWKDAGASDGQIAFSCVGRNLGATRELGDVDTPGPCNYAGGGLFRLNPVLVTDGDKEYEYFAFADVEEASDE